MIPVRDEDAESQRKAKSRQARQTRRATQVWCRHSHTHKTATVEENCALHALIDYIFSKIRVNVESDGNHHKIKQDMTQTRMKAFTKKMIHNYKKKNHWPNSKNTATVLSCYSFVI